MRIWKFVAALLTAGFAATAATLVAGRQAAPVSAPVLDPQQVEDQQDMTWADYHPIPGTHWSDNAAPVGRALRVALVAIDFDDQPFVITRPKHSDAFGNPQIDPVPRADVAKFYANFWAVPGPLNHGHTIHEYWMEQSRGKIGIPKIDPYGPYKMPRKFFEYGLNEYNQQTGCPTGYTCNGRMETDADALWAADAGADIRTKYDVILRIYAGYDETSVWQEFGEMKFKSRDDIPAEFGNPDTTKPRWVVTRYTPWTSWLAGAQQWGLSSVRQGESSGTITHELGHLVFRVGDNNNNPYVTPYRRVGTGPWDMMDRGSFNGPGGPHRRWVVPAAEGAAMPAGLMLRNKLAMDVLDPAKVLQLTREGLTKSGLGVARVAARAVDPGPDAVAGVLVRLDGAAPQDRTPACDRNADPYCAGDPQFNSYSMEVVQRIGYDSFTPDSGVLIAKNKDQQNGSCGYSCHAWVIDARPADINMVDFVKPDGIRVMRTPADYRQLNDALFHAGLGSGTAFEWEDTANRLHFYVINVEKDARGILFYQVGVQSLDGAGPQTRGVAVTGPAIATVGDAPTRIQVRIINTGTGEGSDIYRVAASGTPTGFSAAIQNQLVAIKQGASATFPIWVAHTGAASASASVTVAAVSVSDPTKRVTVTIPVKR